MVLKCIKTSYKLKFLLNSNGPNVPKSYFNIRLYSKIYGSIHFIKLYTIKHIKYKVFLIQKQTDRAYQYLQKYIIIFLK